MNTANTPMTTISGVLEYLRKEKMDTEFTCDEQGLTAGKGKFYSPEEMKLIRTFRFEGDSDPSDMAAIYLLEANDGHLGYVLDAYGAQSNLDDCFQEFIKQVLPAELSSTPD